ncbi:hypothetical protein ACS0TY_011902 [Phlomoides rotata]
MDSIRGGGRDGFKRKGDDINLESRVYHHDNHHYLKNHHRPHHQYFSGVALKLTLLFIVVGIAFLLLNQSMYTTEFFQKSYSFSEPKHSSKETLHSSSSSDNHAAIQQNVLSKFHQFMTENLPSQAKENDLEKMLRKTVMKDKKTVIITTLNAEWSEPNSIFDLFLESFEIGNGTQNLLKHVVVGAFDMKAYSRCMKKGLHCYAIRTEGVDFSGNANLSSEDNLKMAWQKMDFLVTVLEMGYDYVFTDADVMWLRDPFPRFHPDGDFQITCDHFWYNSTDCNYSANTGFKYVKSNNRTIQFYKYWCAGKDYFPEKHDQIVFNSIRFNPFIRVIGLEMRFLETAYFGGFCEPSEDLDLVITMHANCCTGLEIKTQDLKMVINDWKKYISLPSGIWSDLSTVSWTVPRHCGNQK